MIYVLQPKFNLILYWAQYVEIWLVILDFH